MYLAKLYLILGCEYAIRNKLFPSLRCIYELPTQHIAICMKNTYVVQTLHWISLAVTVKDIIEGNRYGKKTMSLSLHQGLNYIGKMIQKHCRHY